ncbi:MAG: sigma factor [Ardenticatenaceae bacterium]
MLQMSNSNPRHFKGLIEPHLDPPFRAAFRLVRDEADAQDLVQETCVLAYQRISELDESRHIKGWLLRVLHNVFVDDARRACRSPVTSLRGSAWARLDRSDVDDPSFTSVLLHHLANHPNDEVRSMAANALAQYIDDPTVRAALEQAEGETSFAVRHAARRALGMVPE